MQLSEQRTLLTSLLQVDLDNVASESPASSDLNGQINYAQMQASKFCKLFWPKITLTLTAGVAIYDIQDTAIVTTYRVVKPYYVTINGTVLLRPDGYRGMWTMEDLWAFRPSWQADTNGTPTAAVQFESSQIILSQPPTSTVVSAGNNFIAGTILAPTLSQDADVSILPIEAHEAVCYIAAIYAAEPIASIDEAINRLAMYNKRAWETLQDIRDTNERLIARMGIVQGAESDDLMYC